MISYITGVDEMSNRTGKISCCAATLICAVLCGCGNNYLLTEGTAPSGSAVLPIVEIRDETTTTEPMPETGTFVCEITPENSFIFDKNKNASCTGSCINRKSSKFPGKVCWCDKTQTLFWSDITGLYMSSENITVKLSDMRAHGLFLYKGKLYFARSEKPLLTSIFPHTYEGGIYCYDILTNELTELSEANASSLNLFDGQIIYDVTEVLNVENGYALIPHKKPLTDGIFDEEYLEKNPFVFDDDIYAYCKPYTNELCVENANKETVFISEPVMGCTTLSIADGRLYYIDYSNGMGKIHSVGIGSGDKRIFSAPNVYIDDYTVIGEVLYATTVGASLYAFDSDGNRTIYYYALERGATEPTIEALYKAGTDIIGIERDGYLYKAGFSENGNMKFVTWERLS